MIWLVFFICAAVCFLGAVIAAIVRGNMKYKSGRLLDPLKILFGGVIASGTLLLVPVYTSIFEKTAHGWFETIVLSIYTMIRLFFADGSFDVVDAYISGLSGWLFHAYSWLTVLVFVLAPILTFGFVLSFFKNLSAYKHYATHYKSEACIFSELNEKSLALAKSLVTNDPKRLLVFTDVFEKDEERNFELIEQAKELGAVCFKKDITTVNFSFHSIRSSLNFFTIGEDHTENIKQALLLIEKFRSRDNCNLYIFSTQAETELLLQRSINASQDDEDYDPTLKIKVRRINDVQLLVSRTLYDTGYKNIFKNAHENEGIKKISAVVVGMGRHGSEMVKALSWFCQMDGYQAEINAFDLSKTAESAFVSACPELMHPDYNGRFDVDGEAKYKITVHSDTDVNTKEFDEAVAAVPQATYVFVVLGDDEKNIATAIKLRSLFARKGCYPVIQAVVYNTEKKTALAGVSNFKDQSYDIDFIGDIESSYSEKVILHSDVEGEALGRHLRWGKEESFWKFDYNYRSSIASAIHKKMKISCNIPGIKKAAKERTEQEKEIVRKLEHCRWNAYMRSEGYSYGPVRNDLAKTHPCLVPFDKLPEEEKVKDDD